MRSQHLKSVTNGAQWALLSERPSKWLVMARERLGLHQHLVSFYAMSAKHPNESNCFVW